MLWPAILPVLVKILNAKVIRSSKAPSYPWTSYSRVQGMFVIMVAVIILSYLDTAGFVMIIVSDGVDIEGAPLPVYNTINMCVCLIVFLGAHSVYVFQLLRLTPTSVGKFENRAWTLNAVLLMTHKGKWVELR